MYAILLKLGHPSRTHVAKRSRRPAAPGSARSFLGLSPVSPRAVAGTNQPSSCADDRRPKEVAVTMYEALRERRLPRWLVGLAVVGSVFTGVACEGSVEGDVDTEDGGGNNEGDGGDGGVDADVDLDGDDQGNE